MRIITLVLSSISMVTCLCSCATKSSIKADPLKVEGCDYNCLEGYKIITFKPFDIPPHNSNKIDPRVGIRYSKIVQEHLKYGFDGLFEDVHFSDSKIDQVKPHHLFIKGTIDKYEPGSPFWRSILIGLGAAKFDGQMIIIDANSQEILLNAPISKLWAWGGLLGLNKDIDDMIDEAAAATAKTIALKAGWADASAASEKVAISH